MARWWIVGIAVATFVCSVRGQNSVEDPVDDEFYEEEEEEVSSVNPKFTSAIQNLKPKKGDTIQLPCAVDQLGPFVFLWKKGSAVLTAASMELTPSPRIKLVNASDNEYPLQIKNIQPEDSGNYTCQISTWNPKEQVHVVDVLYGPTVTTVPREGVMVVPKGTSVTLSCEVTGNPRPIITWYKQGGLLPNGQETLVRPTVEVRDADRKESGIYKCRAENEIGDPVEGTLNLQITYPPEIQVEQSVIYTGEGFDTQLTCIVHAEPMPTVKWLRQNSPLDPSRHVSSSGRDYRHILTIADVQADDLDTYICQATNSLGTDRVDILVSGLPGAATITSPPVGISKDMYKLSWTVESYGPVIEYKLVYRKNKANSSTDEPGMWEEQLVPADPSPDGSVMYMQSFTIRNLEPATVYDVFIESRNKHGWSDQSDMFQFSTLGTDALKDTMADETPKPDRSTDMQPPEMVTGRASVCAASLLCVALASVLTRLS